MARFSDALDRTAETIKRPPPLPIGNYIFRVTKMPDPPRAIEGKPYEILNIPCAPISALDDVDPDELAAFGTITSTNIQLAFIFNTDPAEEMKFEGTLNRLKEFLERCGISSEGRSMKEMLADLPNSNFIGEVKHRVDANDSTIVFAEIGKTAAV